MEGEEARAPKPGHLPSVYLGGPVDYAADVRTHAWRAILHERQGRDAIWYCPMCANAGESDVETIMRRNEIALLASDKALFYLDGTFTIGTPIEIFMRMERRPARSVMIVHPGKLGVFVRDWQSRGALVVPDFSEMGQWLLREE